MAKNKSVEEVEMAIKKLEEKKKELQLKENAKLGAIVARKKVEKEELIKLLTINEILKKKEINLVELTDEDVQNLVEKILS